jgi:hypothetical protein
MDNKNFEKSAPLFKTLFRTVMAHLQEWHFFGIPITPKKNAGIQIRTLYFPPSTSSSPEPSQSPHHPLDRQSCICGLRMQRSMSSLKKSKKGRVLIRSDPLILLMRLLNREDIHDPDTIPEHDKECRVCVCDMHATYPVPEVLDIPCSQRIFKLNKMLLDDSPILFRQIINVLQCLPFDFEAQRSAPRF